MCVRRNAQHREIKLPKSTRFVLNTVLMVAVSTCGPTGVSPPPFSSQNIYSHEKPPTSHRARGETQTMSFELGTNPEGKERVKGRASRVRSSRIGCTLVCVRRNAQHRELKLPKSTRFVLNPVLMVAVSTCGPTGVSPPSLSSQNIQSHENSSTSHMARVETQTMSLALDANSEGKERVEGKASRIQSSRVGSALVCLRRNAQHLELKLPESTRSVLNTVVIVYVSTCGPTGCPVSPSPLRSQNTQSHEKSPTSHSARVETQTTSLALGAISEGKERSKGKASQIQSSRIGFALVCVRRNVKHRELKLPKSTRFGLITAVMVAVPTSGATGCLVSPAALKSQNVQSHEKPPQAIGPEVKHQP